MDLRTTHEKRHRLDPKVPNIHTWTHTHTLAYVAVGHADTHGCKYATRCPRTHALAYMHVNATIRGLENTQYAAFTVRVATVERPIVQDFNRWSKCVLIL